MSENGEQDFQGTADVGAQRVARVYAEAILNTAEKKGQADAVLEEMTSLIQDLFAADSRMESFFSSHAIGRKQKAGLIKSAFAARGSSVFVNSLLVLNNHERLDLLRPIVLAYRELLNERSGRVRVMVRSAVVLPDDQREKLRQELRGALKKEPILETKVDPELLGGLVLQVGDWLYDYSVRTQLTTIRDQIIERSSHEIQSRRDHFCSANGN